MIRLTCVTAVYNALVAGNRDKLIRCVESVSQLKTEHEHLIYDGASADGTVELLRELETKIPGLKVVSEPDTGIYNALNKGVRDAQGEWFYVLGSDDAISHPEIMDGLIGEDPDCEIIHSPVDMTDGKRWKPDTKGLFLGNSLPHQGTLMRTNTIRRFGGFDEQNKVSADYGLFFKAHLEGCKAIYTNESYAMYSVDGLSSNRELCELYDYMVLGTYFKLTTKQFVSRWRASLPLHKIFKYCFQADQAIRESARYMSNNRIKWILYGWSRNLIIMRPVWKVWRSMMRRGVFAR